MINFTSFSSFSRSLCSLISKMVLSISGVFLFLSLFSIAILLCVNKKMKQIISFIFKTTLKRDSTFQCCSQRLHLAFRCQIFGFGLLFFWACPFAFLPTLKTPTQKMQSGRAIRYKSSLRCTSLWAFRCYPSRKPNANISMKFFKNLSHYYL